jgi:hypothetical protein
MGCLEDTKRPLPGPHPSAPPVAAPRTPVLGICGLTSESTPLCSGFSGDKGGGLGSSLSFSVFQFSKLRDCGFSMEGTSRKWAKSHGLSVIQGDGGPEKLYLLAWSEGKRGWFEISYVHQWIPPRASVDVNFVDESLRTLEPAVIQGFDAEFDLDTLLAQLGQDMRCTSG